MDDWVVMAPTRWKLRGAVRTVRRVLEQLNVELHPDKTFIGRAEKGFDFLGYHFSPGSVTVSRPAVQRFIDRVARLYEQGADPVRVGQYAARWIRWARAGAPGFVGGGSLAAFVAPFYNLPSLWRGGAIYMRGMRG